MDEHRPHIGERLRAARESAGLSVSDISTTLKIQTPFVTAIEELDRSSLPSIGYALGYVRAYAIHLGMDGKMAVDAYKNDSEIPENLGIRDRPHFVPKRHIRLPRGFVAATTALSCAAVLAFWYSSQTDAQSALISNFPISGETTVTPQDNRPLDPGVVTIKATAPSWVRIRNADGEQLISRIFVKGESWQVSGLAGTTLSARDSGAIDLYVGETLLGPIGDKGMPVEDMPLNMTLGITE